MHEKFTAIVQQDEQTGNYFLEFPQELLNQLGWEIGDTLNWEDNGNGTYTITKKEK